MVKAVRNATIERHRAKVRERGVLEDLGANLAIDRARAAARFQSVDSYDDAGALDPDEPQTPSLYSSGEAASPEVVAMREFLQTLSEEDRLILQLHQLVCRRSVRGSCIGRIKRSCRRACCMCRDSKNI